MMLANYSLFLFVKSGIVILQRFVGVLIPSMKLEGASSYGRG
jgi:hypothetical protein